MRFKKHLTEVLLMSTHNICFLKKNNVNFQSGKYQLDKWILTIYLSAYK